MDVRIRFEGEFFWYHHLSDVRMVVQEGTSLGTLLFQLGVNLGDGLVSINGRGADVDTVLCHGDDIMIRGREERAAEAPAS
ncbi:MAG TPA: hypothetical protein VD969_02020 [Symbiobacteriaceae bacterium]|nr:hypothetical protein [Symbiobacteriaceae bacterium]